MKEGSEDVEGEVIGHSVPSGVSLEGHSCSETQCRVTLVYSPGLCHHR